MMDQYFGNDSLEPLKANSLAPQARDGIFMAQLTLFNEGVPEHFPICGNFYEGFH